ncbi:MAG: ATPase [Desulfobacteraceae bacterium]|nr:ATPase [Desulfobacteraceae bacterium]
MQIPLKIFSILISRTLQKPKIWNRQIHTFSNRILNWQPSTLILTSFITAIILGALLLKLPAATNTGHIGWINAIFTSTSAVCVTGLVVIDTGSYFSTFGQLVILALIQVGGLGVMTISLILFKWLGRSITFRHRRVMQDLFTHTPRKDIFKLVKNIIFLTFTIEGIGIIVLTVHWYGELGLQRAAYMALFHSVSGFCNAGFSLFHDSMVRYGGSLLLNATLGGLIVLGGIGFPVFYDLQCWFKKRKNIRYRLSIQTKIVLLTTFILIVSGALMFAFLERSALADNASVTQRILTPLFQSMTCRTAGFNTTAIDQLNDATLCMMIFLMFFGASPGSCGGGVKTTTLALLTIFAVSRIRKQRWVNIFKKSVPHETVMRSISLVLISSIIISTVLFLMLSGDLILTGQEVTNVRGSFLPYFFETVSAFGTVGLSMGVTSELNSLGKCLIILTMIIGRVGVLTFAYIIAGSDPVNGVERAEENMMIG